MKIDQQDDNDDKEENPLSMMIISEESNSQMVPSVFSKSMTEKKISKDNFLLSVSLSLALCPETRFLTKNDQSDSMRVLSQRWDISN